MLGHNIYSAKIDYIGSQMLRDVEFTKWFLEENEPTGNTTILLHPPVHLLNPAMYIGSGGPDSE